MARRGGLLLWCLGSAFPTSSSCRGLDLLSRILCSWMVLHGLSRPGKLLLPGSCLLGPASSSCRGPCLECLVFSWRFLGGPRRRVLQLPVHKSGVLRYPYFSTPTGAPGPGPHTVPSVVGPGPNSARARVALVALLLNSASVAPSPGGARLSRRRGGETPVPSLSGGRCGGTAR